VNSDSAQISDEEVLNEIRDEITGMKHDLIDMITKVNSDSKDEPNKMKADSMEKTIKLEPESMDEFKNTKREAVDETKIWKKRISDEFEHIEDMNESEDMNKRDTNVRGCMFEQLKRDASVMYDNYMNQNSNIYNIETCKSMCRGEISYPKNPHYKSGGTCEYIRYMSGCFLYANFALTRGSPRANSLGNLHKMTCKEINLSVCKCDGNNTYVQTPKCQDYENESFDWCYLKKHQDDKFCPGAKKSSRGDFYWTKDVNVCNANQKQDGGLSTWSSWSQCTLSCNGGTRSRTRSCTNPAPAGNGKDCSALGDKLETESCNDNPCKVCEFERTNYDGMTAFDNPLNSVTRGVTKATCESWCKGDTTYTRNSHNKSPQNSKCIYMKWRAGGVCSLYPRFRDARAWHRGSPGNLYQLTCKVLAA